MIRIGGQVVCIESFCQGGPDEWGNALPHFEGVYTVRDIIQDRSNGQIGLHLEEVVNRPLPCFPLGEPGEVAFNIECFRPCLPTSIETLRSLLIPSPAGVSA